MAEEFTTSELQRAWHLLLLVGKINRRGLAPSTATMLLCDTFDQRPNWAARLLQELNDRGHIRVEVGWVVLHP